jgi:NAD+ diphosphatase
MNKKLQVFRGIFNSKKYYFLVLTLSILLGIYKRYIPSVTPDEENNGPAYWFIFNQQDKMLVKVTNNKIKIPYARSIEELNIFPIRTQYLGTLEGHHCYCAEVDLQMNVPEEMAFKDLRSLYPLLDEDLFLLAGRAFQVVNLDKNHQFCGKCGTPTQKLENEMAKICPECGLTSYTRLSPAIITVIVKEGKILMAKHIRTRGNMYGLIAGFIEAGETLEEGVKREIMEEVGLKVKNIKYFGSQPWPFPNSFMIGFTAEYESGEIHVDGNEIIKAKWFHANELPHIPSKMSIARELIDWYIEKYSDKGN